MTTYYTYEVQATARLLPNQKVQFKKGKGYYCSPAATTGCFFAAYIEGTLTYGYHYPAKAPWSNAPGDWTAEGLSNPWPQFEQDAGKKVWGLMFGEENFFSIPGDYDGNFDYTVKTMGAVPVVDVQTSQLGTLADIAAGKYDAQLTTIGKGAAGLGPFILRMDAEMNGGWYPFGAEIRATPQGPATFVAAWQRIYGLFQKAGAVNVAWHWCPNVDLQDPSNPYPPLEELYPGDAYVDWAGMTGYNQGGYTAEQVFNGSYVNGQLVTTGSGTYQRLAKLTSKPIMIGETSSVDAGYPGQKVAYIQDLLGKLPTVWPQVRALTWFNWRTNEHTPPWDWEIESSPEAQAAFQATISVPFFVGRGGTPPLPPPPSPAPYAPAAPVGPFTDTTTTAAFRNTQNPQPIGKLNVQAAEGYGILIMGSFNPVPQPSPSPFTLSDVVAQGITHNPAAGEGTDGFGVWLGAQTVADRINCSSAATPGCGGMWTGCQMRDATVSNLYARGPTGLYCEHFTRRVAVTNFDIASTAAGGHSVNIEWTYKDSAYASFYAEEYPEAAAAFPGRAGSCYITLDGGTIYCPAGGYGIYADAGTFGCLFKNITFTGPGNAVCLPTNLAMNVPNVVDPTCVFQNTGGRITSNANAIG